MIRTLIIEDDQPTRALLENILLSRSHEVTTCANAETAWGKYRSVQSGFDLILLDLLLPDMDGLELCKKIRSHRRGTKSVVLVLTARDQARDLELVLDAGADDYLPKPIDPKLLNIRLTIAERKVRDITKRIIAERTSSRTKEALAESEKKYRWVVENINEIIYLITLENHSQPGIVELVSGQAERIIGYQPHEFTDNPKLWYDIIHSEDRSTFFECSEKILSGKYSGICSYRVKHKTTGKYIWLEDKISPSFDKDGNVTGYIGVARDISARKQTEEELKRLKDFNESILRSMAEGITVIDINGRIVYLNPMANSLLGYEQGELLGKNWSQIVPKDQQPIVNAADERRRQGISDSYQLELIRKDGKRIHVMVSGSPRYKNDRFVGTMAVFTDITERKRAADILASLNTIASRVQSRLATEDVYEILSKELSRLGIHVAIFRFTADHKEARLEHHSFVSPVIQKIEQITGYKTKKVRVNIEETPSLKDLITKRRPIIIEENLIKIIKYYIPNITDKIASRVADFLQVDKAIIIPIFLNQDIVGTIILLTRESVKHIIPALPLFSAQVSSALKNAHLFARVTESEKKYRSIFENSPVGIAVHQNGKIVFINPLAAKILGYKSSEELINMPVLNFVHKNYWPIVKDRIKMVLSNPDKVAELVEEKFIRRDGSSIDVATVAQAITYQGSPAVQVFFIDNTARKIAEEELRKFSLIIDQTEDQVMITDTNGIIEYVNSAFEENTGYDKEFVIGKKPSILKSGKQSDNFYSSLWKTISAGKKFSAVFINKKRDGTLFYDEKVISPLINRQGEITHFVSIGKDITVWEEREKEILQLSAFPEENPHPVFRTDLNGNVSYANPAAFNILKEMHSKDRDVSWLLPDNCKQIIDDLIKNDKVICTTEYQRNGYTFLGEIHVPKGMDVAHIYLTDITDRVKQEETSRRLYIAVEQAAESIVITDTEGLIQYVNPAFEKITGYNRQEVIGHRMDILKSDTTNDTAYEDMWEALKREEIWTHRMTNKRKDGTLYEEEMTVSPVRDPQGEIVNYVSVGRDVTQEVILEEQLRQAKKLEAVGRLAAGISHDFNNILTGIIGYADLALACLPEDHNLRENFVAIIKKADDAAILIRQLMAFSRKQILEIRQLDVNHIVLQSVQFLKRVLRDDIDLTTELNQTPCIINGDSTALQQIITNLCVNAQDAMPKGGQIAIHLGIVNLDEDFCHSLPELSPGEYVKLSISDTGVGMETDVQEHIFEPFFTTKKVGEGTGLGLSIVYGLVKQHKGAIRCSTQPDLGTTFEIYFPSTTIGISKEEEPSTRKIIKGKETILIVEDDLDVLNVLKKILDRSGYKTLIAKDGFEGFKLLKEKKDKIDLVITDIYMPRMSGTDLFNKANRFIGKTRFLFISGYTKQANLESNQTYLQKPFTSNQLTEKIRELLEKEN